MQVEDRLAAAGPHVDEDAIVLEPGLARCVCDKVQHPLGLVRRVRRDIPERVDVALGKNQEMRLGDRVDVADRDEPVALLDVVAFADELAEEAVVARQRGSPPR